MPQIESDASRPATRAGDVWSLGALLYELLSGRSPYEPKDTYEQTIIQIVTQKIPALAETAPWVPASVCEVVERALCHDLERRTGRLGIVADNRGAPG